MYLYWESCMKTSLRGPMRVTLCIEIQGELCFPLYICLYCLNFSHEHVLFIEPEIAHRKLFSLKGGREMKEACPGPGTLCLRRPEPQHWQWWRTRVLSCLAPLKAAPPSFWRRVPPTPSNAIALISYFNGHHCLFCKLLEIIVDSHAVVRKNTEQRSLYFSPSFPHGNILPKYNTVSQLPLYQPSTLFRFPWVYMNSFMYV